MRMAFRDRRRLGVIINPRLRIRTRLDELFDMRASLRFVQQAKCAAYADVHERLAVFLHVGQVNHGVHVFQQFGREGNIRQVALDNFYTGLHIAILIIRHRADAISRPQKFRHDGLAQLPAGTRHQHIPDMQRIHNNSLLCIYQIYLKYLNEDNTLLKRSACSTGAHITGSDALTDSIITCMITSLATSIRIRSSPGNFPVAYVAALHSPGRG